MEIRNLIKRLKEHKIDLSLDGNDLEVNFDGEELPEALLAELKLNKKGIIDFLRQVRGEAAAPIPALPPSPNGYKISSAQRRLWVLSQFEESSAAYNNADFFVFEGELNVAALEYAFNTVIERHETMRTVFREDEEGEVKQFILTPEELGFKIIQVDLRQAADKENKARELLYRQQMTPFKMDVGPLLSAGLYRMEDTKWICAYVVHHVLSDGVTGSLFTKELFTFYGLFVQGVANPFPPMRIHYKDYVAWQLEQLSGEQLHHHRNYWLSQFEGELPVLDLPGDRPRPAIKTFNGNSIHTKIGSDTVKRLKGMVQERGGTLFMGMMTAVNILLYRYTGQTDIVVGFPIAGREHPDLEDQFGFYVNTLPMRTRFSSSDTAQQLFENVKQVTLGAYEHQIYPFGEMLEDLKPERDMSRNPLFDIMVVLHNINTNNAPAGPSPEGETLGDTKVSVYKDGDNTVSKFDLSINLDEKGDAVEVTLEYNTDIFDQPTIERLGRHLLAIMDALPAQLEVPVGRLQFLTDAEKGQVLRQFNDTAAEYPRHKTVVQLFEEQAAEHPGNIALNERGFTLTYQQLNEQANQVAAYLIGQHNIQPGDIVAVQLNRSAGMVVAILGILKAGAAYLPIDPGYPQERIAYMVADSRCKLVVDEKALQSFATVQQQYGNANPAAVAGPQHMAYVIYTSGSTGQPKGVMVAHQSLCNYCTWYRGHFALTAADRTTLYVGVGFDVSVMEIFPCLATGAALYVVPDEIRLDVEALSAFYDAQQISIAYLPPRIAENFLQVPNQSLRCLTTGGDKLNVYVPTRYSFQNNYGPTEATIMVTNYPVTAQLPNIPIGKPIANTQLYIVNDSGEPCAVGMPGEICIAGDALAMGYLNQPELTAEKFVPNPFAADGRLYKTGDQGRWLPDGNILFLGRTDGQVKIRGHRVELGEIEAALQSHPAVDNAVVKARTGHDGEKELVAYIISQQGMEDGSVLHKYLNGKLPPYMVPAYFVPLEALPINANGKVDRKKLPDPEGIGLAVGVEYVAPRNETEEKLVRIWQELLGREKIGIKDNFFAIGGHSLNATRLASYIRREFNVNLPLPTLFNNTTIENIAAEIEKTYWANNELFDLEDSENITV
jgi:amino acid adenylation domain-containing protein